MVEAIQQDAERITSEPGEDAEAAFLRAFQPDAEKPSDADDDDPKKAKPPVDTDSDTSEETPEDDDEEDTDGETDDDTESDEETSKQETQKRVVLDPEAEAYVKHKVDGKDIEIPVKDLTRLYGQEAALTRKSQETAEARKAVDETGAKYTAGLEALQQRALERFKPYADINFLALAKDPNITAEDLAALQKQAQDTYADVTYLTQKLDETLQENQKVRHAALVKQAGESWKSLADPATGIPGWGDPLYNEIRTYAKGAGIPSQTVDELVDPVAMKLLHKAMLYDKGTKAEVKVTKVDKQPKRIIKSSSEQVVTSGKGRAASAPMARLAQTGSVDDAADVFFAQMTSS